MCACHHPPEFAWLPHGSLVPTVYAIKKGVPVYDQATLDDACRAGLITFDRRPPSFQGGTHGESVCVDTLELTAAGHDLLDRANNPPPIYLPRRRPVVTLDHSPTAEDVFGRQAMCREFADK